MAKNTMGTKLPRKLEQKMALMGEQIKLARLRRNLSIAQVAERATCSPLTVNRIEKGSQRSQSAFMPVFFMPFNLMTISFLLLKKIHWVEISKTYR